MNTEIIPLVSGPALPALSAEVALQERNRVALVAGIKVARHKNGSFQEHRRAPELAKQRAGIEEVFGSDQPVQRCRNHKMRNVLDELPRERTPRSST